MDNFPKLYARINDKVGPRLRFLTIFSVLLCQEGTIYENWTVFLDIQTHLNHVVFQVNCIGERLNHLILVSQLLTKLVFYLLATTKNRFYVNISIFKIWKYIQIYLSKIILRWSAVWIPTPLYVEFLRAIQDQREHCISPQLANQVTC